MNQMKGEIRTAFAESSDDVERCAAVLQELRTHLNPARIVEQARRQAVQAGYRLAFVEHGGSVQAVAGFRIQEFLAWGRTLYVDDLVTTAAGRSKGYGERLFLFLVEQARVQDCDQFHLDSGVQRFAAHRFYLRMRMIIGAHHFVLDLRDPAPKASAIRPQQ